ncbi:hypothetical protein CBP51_10070 [Cellvibrio mixtus]|uniref:Uncharacterized protein n=1 Tax=Cellvibrio mixtus TaxID=39650 RepID=A0A266QD76_9GAMM|nr:hypothetical protein [Cellvibrio mixtus]OZY87301.1 hypothetical protein CBP51_10070 [Cellvibrio mixtus]
MTDGTAMMLGGVELMSEGIYGQEFDYNLDFMESVYRTGAEALTGNAAHGDVARSIMSLGGVLRANTVKVDTLVNFNPNWGMSALTYRTQVPAFYTSTRGAIYIDAVSVADSIKTINDNR